MTGGEMFSVSRWTEKGTEGIMFNPSVPFFATLRDTLLPKLLSGELRISEEKAANAEVICRTV